MQKEELLRLLQDPDICREIFLIIKNSGKPNVQTVVPKATSASKAAPASETEKLSAIKDILKKKSAIEKKMSPSTAAVLNMAKTLPKEIPQEDLHAETISAVSAVSTGDSGSFGDKLALLRNQVQKENEERAAQLKAAEEKKSSGAGIAEQYTFILERPCPVCGLNTRVVKCKSRLIAEKTDLDLCIHYKDINPYLYRVWACEHCGYAADEQKFIRRMPEKTQDKLLQFLQTADLALPFSEVRTSEQAIQYIEMAILFNELSDPSPNRRANLYRIMAWIYRYDGDEAKEQDALGKAAELFDLSLETENYPVDKMSDTTATYLAGAIHVLRHDYDKATRHLSRLISNQSLRSSAPKIYEMARDMWQDIKTAKKN